MTRRTPEQVYQDLLVLRAQDGDERALGELLEAWRPRLFVQAVHLLGDADAADDATQEAVIAAMKGLRGLADPAAFGGWLLRILSNKAADAVRRGKSRRAATERLAEESPTTVDPKLPDDEDDDIALLRAALMLLPGDRRALLTMFYLRSMSVQAIASALGIPAGTVKSRLFHAREQLKKVMNRSAG